jgi:hypothetical protein
MIETFQSIPLVDPESREGQSFLREVVADLVGFEALGIPPLAGGAEIFPDEGLDHVLNKVPRATAAIQTTYYLGLFTGSTATTVPARTDTLAAAPASVAEPSGGAYARVAVANTDWGAIATNGVGRRTTSAQKSFPPSTGAWGTVNGFFLANQLAAGAGAVAIFYANFDDLAAVNVNAAGYTIQVTPYFHIDQ